MSRNLFDALIDAPEDIPKTSTETKLVFQKEFMGRDMQNVTNDKSQFSIVTYNILCSKYCKEFQYPYCNPKDLSWDVRRGRIIKELESYSSDIICLQEVDRHDWVLNRLKYLGYQGIYKQRTRGKPDGCSIFYKGTMELMDTDVVELNNVNTTDCKDPDNYMTDNIAILAKFKYKSVEFCVANVHIYWDPSYPEVKLAQTNHLLENMKKFSDGMKKAPWILCGDFNSMPDSQVYEFITTGKVKSLEISHPLTLKSIFPQEPKFTNYTATFVGTLDYIFHNQYLKCCRLLKPISEKEAKSKKGLPNHNWPSDHIALYAEFTLKHFISE